MTRRATNYNIYFGALAKQFANAIAVNIRYGRAQGVPVRKVSFVRGNVMPVAVDTKNNIEARLLEAER